MNRTVIIYLSKTGFTEKYAKWAAEETGAEIISFKEAKKCRKKILSDFGTIIFGSRLLGGMIEDLRKAKKLFYIGDTRFAVFVTGATPNDGKDTAATLKKMWKQNFTADELDKIPHFYMQPGLCYEKMPFIEKKMMNALKAMLKKKTVEGIPDGMAEALGSSFDNSDKKLVYPLTEWINS